LQKEVGRGSFGCLYQAWDSQYNVPVAVKQAFDTSTGQGMLRREAAVLSRLDHPCIPQYIDLFEAEGKHYLVESWCAGKPLSQYPHCELEQILDIGQQCCQILSYLHEQDLVHRDLNPGNVLLAEDGIVFLVDFGCARFKKEQRVMEGTPGYVAPEQWRSGLISPKCDVYGLGMLLGCKLTKTKPEDVRKVGGMFLNLYDDVSDLPPETLPLVDWFDRMITQQYRYRPDLLQVSAAFLTLLAQFC
jgi:serine/threonine protein kinase